MATPEQPGSMPGPLLPTHQAATGMVVVAAPHLPQMENVGEVRTVMERVSEVRTVLGREGPVLMGAATPARAEGGVLMQAAVPDSGASLQQPKQARAAAASPESYLRLEIHVENGQLSVAGIKEVAGPLAVPTSVIHGYVYEALVGGQQVAIGSVPDVGVRRAFANRDVPGKEGKHNFVPVPEFDFYVRVPKAQLSIASLPAMVVILHNVRSVPDRIESATPLALQPGVQSDEVGRLGGVQLQRLEPAVRAQFESLLRTP